MLEFASLLTPAVATLPPLTVFRIGSAPVAFSIELEEPPKFTGVQSFLYQIDLYRWVFPSIGR